MWYDVATMCFFKRTCITKCLSGISLLLVSSVVCAKETIKWLEMDAPPYHIQTGDMKNHGIVDQVTQLLQQSLPQYLHSEKLMNLPRIVQVMRVGQEVCHASLYKTPQRETVAYFSKVPSTMFPPVGLTIRRDNYGLFNEQPLVSLADVLSRSDVIGGISKGRSYGESLDTVLKRFERTARLEIRSGDDIYHGLFRMLLYGRVDYVLGSPLESGFVQQSLASEKKVLNLRLEERNTYDFGFVACSKTPWGKRMIQEINEVLIKIRPTQQYQSYFTKWLDELSRESFKQAYHQQFLVYGLNDEP